MPGQSGDAAYECNRSDGCIFRHATSSPECGVAAKTYIPILSFYLSSFPVASICGHLHRVPIFPSWHPLTLNNGPSQARMGLIASDSMKRLKFLLSGIMTFWFTSTMPLSPTESSASPKYAFTFTDGDSPLLILIKGKFPFPTRDHHVPGSDGAGVVEAVGSKVTRFKPGDKVVTLFNQGHIGGYIDPGILGTGLGGSLDGTLRQYGAFNEQGLVAMPSTLDFKQASTLPCAGVTAWNALYGLEGRALKAGDTVLTQGTGGVSIFALQVR